MIGFAMGMVGLLVGGMMFSGSLLFALTFALPLLFGAGAIGMMSFWAFGLASVAFSLALPVLFFGVRVGLMLTFASIRPAAVPFNSMSPTANQRRFRCDLRCRCCLRRICCCISRCDH